ncbi:MAG: glucose 1-dehydrogenase [Actinomycetota bacterium]|nr:glucose 1-dehydrogenase [Actinomycetota bacterium]
MGKLEDRVALITGSDSGIGQASAVEFAREGADVVINYLHDEQGANRTKADVEAHGQRAIVVQADHGYEDQVERLFGAALDAFGKVDVLMNNASVDASGVYVADLEIENYERTLRSNLIGPVLCCKHFVRHRKQQGGGGKIINVTSIHEDIPNPGGADYDTSKSALRMLTRTLALELVQDGINVNNLAPGMVLTPFNQKAIDDPEFRKQQVQSIPMKRAAQPEEIAKLALFLASSDSDYVTGSTYIMDGGLMRNVGQGA